MSSILFYVTNRFCKPHSQVFANYITPYSFVPGANVLFPWTFFNRTSSSKDASLELTHLRIAFITPNESHFLRSSLREPIYFPCKFVSDFPKHCNKCQTVSLSLLRTAVLTNILPFLSVLRLSSSVSHRSFTSYSILLNFSGNLGFNKVKLGHWLSGTLGLLLRIITSVNYHYNVGCVLVWH